MNKENGKICKIHYNNLNSMIAYISDKDPIVWRDEGNDIYDLVYREAIPGIYRVKSLTLAQKGDRYSDLYRIVISDRTNDEEEITAYINRDDIYNIQNFPYILTYLTVRYYSNSGLVFYSTPLGVEVLSDIDETSFTISKFPDVMYKGGWKKRKDLLKDGFMDLQHSQSWSNDRIMIKMLADIPDELHYALFGVHKITASEDEQKIIDNIRVYDIDATAEDSNDMIEFLDAMNKKSSQVKTRKYDDTILKKIKVALLDENYRVICIKKTNMPLCKNKVLYYGNDAGRMRILIYEKIKEICKEQYGVDNICLMEAYWVRRKTSANIIIDKDGNKNKTLYMPIDNKTHLNVSQLMFLANGERVNQDGEIEND